MKSRQGVSGLEERIGAVSRLVNNLLKPPLDDTYNRHVSDLEAGVKALQQSYADFKATLADGVSTSDVGIIWQLSCVLWNLAIDITAKGLCSSRTVSEQVAWIRHTACSLALDIPQQELQEAQSLQLIRFCLKSSESWAALDRWEQAELLLASAARLVTATCSTGLADGQIQLSSTQLTVMKAEEYCGLVYEVHLARYTAACKTNQQELAREALAMARVAAEHLAPSTSSSSLLCYKLARCLHGQVMQDIQSGAVGADGNLDMVHGALKAAYDLVLKAKALGQDDTAADAGATATKLKKLLQLEAKVLLCLAYLQLQFAKDPAACLKCTEALRQLETDEGSHPAVSLLAFKAFVALGMLEEAEKEATGIAVSDATSRETCQAVLLELLSVPGRTAQLKPVLQLVLGRFPSDPVIITSFTQQALEAATKAAAAAATSTDAAECQQHHQTCDQLQKLVLEQLEAAAELKQALCQEPTLQTELRDALYQHGLTKFTAKDFDMAVKFFGAALEVCEDRVKGRVARVLAMCHLGQQQLDKAKNFCGLSDTYEPGVIATSFIRFKILLLEGNESGLLEELTHMITCNDYCNDMLWFAFKEANTANATTTAKAALEHLHNLLQKQEQQSGDAADATAHIPECIVLRVWVRVLLDELQKHIDAVKAGQQAEEAATDNNTDADLCHQEQQAAAAAACQCLAQLSEVLSKVNMRVKRLGLEVFAGEKESAAVQQLEWFATCAWNEGLHSAGLKDYQGAAVLMNLSAQLFSQLPSLGPKQLRQQRLAYTIAASAGLEVHKKAPEHQGSLRLANRMCQAATAVGAKLSAGLGGSAMASTTDGTAEAFTLMLQFRVALCTKNTEELKILVDKMIAHPCVGADILHQLHHMCSHEPHKYSDIAGAALEGSLHKLMSSKTPNHSQVAVILRMLLQRAASDVAKLKLYREACGILTTSPPGSYPEVEAAWLFSTCWNRGMHHLKFDRKVEAAEYMQAAVDMLPACQQHAGQKAAMVEQLRKVQLSMSASTHCSAAVVVNAS